MRQDVDLKPFQEAFAKSNLKVADIVRRTGLEHTYLSRVLGKKPGYSTDHRTGKGYYWTPRSINYDSAVLLADALNMDYHEAGV